jgi:hypothetical protein
VWRNAGHIAFLWDVAVHYASRQLGLGEQQRDAGGNKSDSRYHQRHCCDHKVRGGTDPGVVKGTHVTELLLTLSQVFIAMRWEGLPMILQNLFFYCLVNLVIPAIREAEELSHDHSSERHDSPIGQVIGQ